MDLSLQDRYNSFFVALLQYDQHGLSDGQAKNKNREAL